MNAVCLYLGSSPGARPEYEAAVSELATMIAQRGMTLVYGGGNVGLMGIAANAALAAGGKVIGVIPADIADKEVGHHGLTELQVVDSMHERKMRMAKLADGIIALPGGLGTLEELFEMLTWSQLGFHNKPIGLLNVTGYFDLLLAFLDHMVVERFVKQDHRDLLMVERDPGQLLDRLTSHVPRSVDKWLDMDRT
ncbi:MAG: TIGR00730 family Rossman fold protein [Halioglobus sp.]